MTIKEEGEQQAYPFVSDSPTDGFAYPGMTIRQAYKIAVASDMLAMAPIDKPTKELMENLAKEVGMYADALIQEDLATEET